MRALLPFCLLLASCAPITRIGDKIIGLTNPVLVGGLVIGTQPPDDPQLRAILEAQGIGEFTEVQLVVADALELKDLDGALLTDPGLSIAGPSDSVTLQPEEDSWFRAPRQDTPRYVPGETWTITADLKDRILPGTVEVPLPPAAAIPLGIELQLGEDHPIDIEGQGYEAAFAVVFDADGNEIWTNAPLDTESIVDLVLPAADPVRSVTIPGDTFEAEDVYMVGFAGLRRAPVEGIEGLNEALTAVFAGQLQLYPAIVGSRIASRGLLIGVDDPPADLRPLLDGAGFDTGGSFDLFAADLLAQGAPVRDAALSVDDESMTEIASGHYRIEGLVLQPGDAVGLSLVSDLTEVEGMGLFEIPTSAEVDLPATSPRDAAVTMGLVGGPYSGCLVTVVGPDGVTWSNVPTNETATEWTASNPGEMTEILLPAVAFPTPGPYAIAAVALEDVSSDLSGFNPRFSSVQLGQMGFHGLQITP